MRFGLALGIFRFEGSYIALRHLPENTRQANILKWKESLTSVSALLLIGPESKGVNPHFWEVPSVLRQFDGSRAIRPRIECCLTLRTEGLAGMFIVRTHEKRKMHESQKSLSWSEFSSTYIARQMVAYALPLTAGCRCALAHHKSASVDLTAC